MNFNLYSLFTTTLLISLFILIFVVATNINGIIRRIPLWVVYVFLAVMGIRLLISLVEIPLLSHNVNSHTILRKLNDIFKFKVFTYGEFSLSVINTLFIIWIIGIFVRLVNFCIKYHYFRTMIKQFVKIEDKHILDTVSMICNKLKIKSIPEVYMTTSNCSPSEYGLFKQKIVLNSITYTDDEMYYILLHEITHYKLKNDIAKCFAKILEIVFWWNPAVYSLYNRIDKLMEIYTDLSVTKNLNETQKYDYLKCLCSVYKSINVRAASLSAFTSPVIGRVKENEIEKRFKVVAEGEKTNIPIYIFMLILTFACYFSTVLVVFQPYYDMSKEGVPSVQLGINNSNSYIVKEDDIYVLYYNGGILLTSPNKEDLEAFLK